MDDPAQLSQHSRSRLNSVLYFWQDTFLLLTAGLTVHGIFIGFVPWRNEKLDHSYYPIRERATFLISCIALISLEIFQLLHSIHLIHCMMNMERIY